MQVRRRGKGLGFEGWWYKGKGMWVEGWGLRVRDARCRVRNEGRGMWDGGMWGEDEGKGMFILGGAGAYPS